MSDDVNDLDRYTIVKQLAEGRDHKFFMAELDGQMVGLRQAKHANTSSDAWFMKKFVELQVSPKLIGFGTDTNGRVWQAMELYDGNIFDLLKDDFCRQHPTIVDLIETQLYEMFSFMARNAMFCFDVKAGNTVYKLNESKGLSSIQVRLIDMNDSTCFMKVPPSFKMTTNDISFAQLAAFNNNTAEPNGECRGRPFFKAQMKKLRDQINDEAVLKLLSQQQVASYLHYYGQRTDNQYDQDDWSPDGISLDVMNKALGFNSRLMNLRPRRKVPQQPQSVLSGGARIRKSKKGPTVRRLTNLRKSKQKRVKSLHLKRSRSRAKLLHKANKTAHKDSTRQKR